MGETLSGRKKRHLDICLDPDSGVETGSSGLSEIRLPHRAIPSADTASVDLETEFLGYRQSLPLMVSCMTGGTEEGRQLNRLLARIAGERRIAFGLGSMRVMLRHPEKIGDFAMKSLCPDSPLLANIGAAQLSEFSVSHLVEAVKRLDADGLYVHLNPAQELFQEGGDTNFSSWRDDLYRLVETAGIPVLIKETGAGVPPLDGIPLLQRGAAFVDVSGAGGTDWVAVESHRDRTGRVADHGFLNWGYSTAELLWAYRKIRDGGDAEAELPAGRIIASGGLRLPVDFAVALGTGAWIAAAALPFLRRAADSGGDGVHSYLDDLERGIRSAVVLSGSDSLEGFRTVRPAVSGEIDRRADYLVNQWKAIKER